MELKNKNIPIKFKVLILAALYFLVGYFSLKLSIPSTNITPIFPAASVAFIGIYFWGYRAWPGLALGSLSIDFAVHITGSNTIDFYESISIGIATGVVLQTLFVVWTFKKYCNPPQFFNSVQNILWFAVLPTGIGAFISPLIGTIAVSLNGVGDWSSFGAYIASGWLAESTGILTIIPVFWVTVFKHSSIDLPIKKNVFEYFLFVFFIFITGQIVFGKVIGAPNYPLVYSLFPFLVWAAFRFGSLATLLTALTICCFSVWGSLNEGGPFVGRSSFETLVLLQAYCWFVMVTALVLIGAVTERVVSENKLKESNRLLDSIREIQNKYMTEGEPKILFDDLLNKFINLTESAFGFIGEILHDNKGDPYLKTYSITNIAWDESTKELYDRNSEVGLEFRNMDTLFGQAILNEKPVISNSPKQDPRSYGLPLGHPDLNSFLGIPIHIDKRLVGMVGVANRREGYQKEIVKFLEPLISTSGQLILKFRKEKERLEIESQLKLEREKLKSIADKLPVLIAYVDSEMRYQFNNKAYFDWMGLAPEELRGKKVEEVLGERGFLSIKPYIESVLKGEPQYYETRLPHPKREELRYIAASYIPHKNLKGEIEGYTALIQDLTDRKKAEEEIAERERQLKSIMDNTPAIIFMKDMQGRYILVNKKNEEVIGLKNEKIIGKTTHELFPKEIADAFIKHDQMVMKELKAIEVEELVPLNGSLRTMLSVQFPLVNEDGTPYGICGISTDITERKTAENKLQDYKDQLENIIQERTKELTEANVKLNEITNELQISEERAKFALEATTDGFWDWNLETDEVFFSDTWLESLGYTPGDLKFHLNTWKSLVHPADMPKVMEVLAPHLEGKTSFYQCENRLLTKSGHWRWNLDQGKVVKRDANGNPLRMVGSDTDITEWKKSEEELKKSQDQILHMEKLSALGKLTGSIAHEFNNPIYGTKIILEQLRDEAKLSDQQQKGLSLAIKECYRMADLIAKLRDFYQPTSKKRVRVNIHDLLFDVLLLMKNKFKEKNISIVNEFEKALPEVVVVGDQIKQVLLNVIQNAEDSFIESSIKNKLIIKTESKEDNVYIRVQDNGVGISKEHIKNLFDPFFTTKASVKGTGLGLSISHGIIKDHGGSIEVKSKFGRGSTFSIKLPVRDAENEKS
jgi:PAS domain S-box-containing protein